MNHHRWMLCVPILLAAVVASCGKRGEPALTGSGTMEATEVTLSSIGGGEVVRLAVAEGDTVSPGTVIAVIDTEKIALQRDQLSAGLAELRPNFRNAERSETLAKENLDNIEKKWNRARALMVDSSITQQQADDAETAWKAAQIQFENARSSVQALEAKADQITFQIKFVESQIRDAVIISPIRGTVISKLLEQGELARPGSAVASVADLENLWIKIYFGDRDIARIHLNDRAELTASGLSRPVTGRVSWISPKAEFTPKMVQTREARADLVYAVKVEVKNSDGSLKIGMPADVTLVSNP
jgi:HlyD family secretion protein